MIAATAILLPAIAWLAASRADPDRAGPVALFTTLPILWPETGDVGEILDSAAPAHWATTELGGGERIRALDLLVDGEGRLPLPTGALLVMAQPRPLAPQENVALDDWVRAGGRVLLFADPLLTAPSIHPLGDRRRPQDVVLLSPILKRWGLELRFDDEQPPGRRDVSLLGGPAPVNLPGSFALVSGTGRCELLDAGLAARCDVGKGRVLAVADAALLETGDLADLEMRRAALLRLRDSLR